MASTFEALLLSQVTFLLNRPQAALVQLSTTTAMASSGWTSVTFDGSNTDTYNGHSSVTNPSRYTCQVPGWYRVCGVVSWPTATGTNWNKWARLAKNGTAIGGSASQMSGNTTTADVSATATPEILVQLNVGDYVELQGAQFTGGTINTRIGADGGVSALYIMFEHF